MRCCGRLLVEIRCYRYGLSQSPVAQPARCRLMIDYCPWTNDLLLNLRHLLAEPPLTYFSRRSCSWEASSQPLVGWAFFRLKCCGRRSMRIFSRSRLIGFFDSGHASGSWSLRRRIAPLQPKKKRSSLQNSASSMTSRGSPANFPIALIGTTAASRDLASPAPSHIPHRT